MGWLLTYGIVVVGTALSFFIGTQVPIRLPPISVTVGDSKVALLPFITEDRCDSSEDQGRSLESRSDYRTRPFPVLPASSSLNGVGWQTPTAQDVDTTFSKALETEAQLVVKRAQIYHLEGRSDKAERLFQRAVELAPRSADVLSAYGKYLHEVNDPMEAERLLVKALQVRPGHAEALHLNQRNALLVEEIDRYHFLEIDRKRNILQQVPRNDSAFVRALRENYMRHVYHSNAIEGNTMTLAMVRSVLETGLAVAGKSVREHNDIIGLDLALAYINQTIMHQKRVLSLQDLIEMHTRLMGHSQPLDAGKLRSTQVYVSAHVPPPPSRLEELMEGFGQWMVSAEANSLHPIARAAVDHFKLVHIHPFVDGNGRLSRLLMNVRLMQAGYPPVIIPVHERSIYYESLSLADNGDVRPFVRYISNLTERTIEEYLMLSQKPKQLS